MEAIRFKFDGAFRDVLFKETYIVGYDRSQLHVAEWWPEKFPRAMVLLVHGLGDHILRFKQLANYFNNNQIAVLGVDLRGHGKSGGRRGACFYSSMMNDYSALIEYSKKKYPHIPKVLYGQSLGGNLAMNYVISNRTKFAGVISTSPWIRPVREPAFASFQATRYLRLFTSLITTSSRVRSTDLSHDRNVLASYEDDPLVHRKLTLPLFHDASDAGGLILRNKHKISIPLLLMHGSGDKITSCAASSDFAKNTSSLTNFKLWHGAFHELHNEIEKEEIYDYLSRWILNLPQIQR